MKREVAIFINARDKASKGFDKVRRSGSKMTSGLQKAGAGLTKQFSGFGSIGTASIMKIVGALGILLLAIKTAQVAFKSFIQQGVMANARMETLKMTLATTLKSMTKATEALAWAQEFAAKTPFQIPEVVEATVRLETYGIKAKETLRLIGDMASTMGKPLMQAIEAIADAQTGELERLKEFGITKRQLIEAGAKVNARGQIQDMKSVNDALIAIMEDRFAGGMERMSTTFQGIVSNLKDAWGTLQRQLAAPTFEVIKDALKDVLGWVNKLRTEGKLDEWVNRVGQSIAKLVRIIIHLPEIFSLVIQSFVAFVKKLGDWEFASRALVEFGKFIVVAIGGAMQGAVKIVLSVGKIIWKPLEIAFFGVMTGIVNLSDAMITEVWHGIKWLTVRVIDAFNWWIVQFNKFRDQINTGLRAMQLSMAITSGSAKGVVDALKGVKIELPEIPIITIEPDISQDFNKMYDRMEGRSSDFGQFWEQGWRETGEVAQKEAQNIATVFKDYMTTMGYTAKQTIIPIMKEAIPSELLARFNELGAIINKKVTPSITDMGFQAKEATTKILEGADLDIKSVKKRAKAYEDLRQKQIDIIGNLSRKWLDTVLSDTQMFELTLQKEVSDYEKAGFAKAQIDTYVAKRREEFFGARLEQTEEMNARIAELTGQSIAYELEQLEIKAAKYAELGANQFEIDNWLALERARVNLEADETIRKSGVDTWQTITKYTRKSIGVARQLFKMLSGTSNKTWQSMIADVIEWGGQLISKYLMTKGMEMMRRAEGMKTHQKSMQHHAEELATMASKFLLAQDYVRAGIAGVAAAVAAGRAATLSKEIKETDKAGKKYVALGLAVEAGTMIASEAMEGWGQRAEDSRQRQESALQDTQRAEEITAQKRSDIEQQLQSDITTYREGAQAQSAIMFKTQQQEYRDLGVDPALLGQWEDVQRRQTAGVEPQQPYTISAPLPVQVINAPGIETDVSPAPAIIGTPSPDTFIASREGMSFQQTNYFEGLINFDNPEALRELARKLLPYTEELEENWQA